jgi:hypothetical protein
MEIVSNSNAALDLVAEEEGFAEALSSLTVFKAGDCAPARW